jgi:hypothetical protein
MRETDRPARGGAGSLLTVGRSSPILLDRLSSALRESVRCLQFMSERRTTPLNFGVRTLQGGCLCAPTTSAKIDIPKSISYTSFAGLQTNYQASFPMGPSPRETLNPIFDEIEKALQAQLYYAALGTALTIPDICAALLNQRGTSSSTRYADWYDKHMEGSYVFALPGVECYKLRCGVLHQARIGRDDMIYHRVFFTVGSVMAAEQYIGNVVNGVKTPDQFGLNLPRFCRSMVEAARNWLEANHTDPIVAANLPRVFRRRPEGLPPFGFAPLVIA